MIRLLASFLAAALALQAPALAQPRDESGPSEGSVRAYLEQRVIQRFGPAGRDAAQRARESILVDGAYGEFAEVSPRILIRAGSGWTLWGRGGASPLAAPAGREIDRLLASAAFWREDHFSRVQRCTGGAMVMVIRYRGRERVTRQDCRPAGLTGRLAAIAAGGAIPAPERPPVPGPAAEAPSVSRIVWERSQASVAAWNRGDLQAYLAPYADDVTIVWPTGIEYNKALLRTRAAQALRAPVRRSMTVQGTTLRALGPAAAIQTSHIYYSGGGRGPSQSRVTSIWENRAGIWEVTHEQVGPEMPGHSR